VGALEQSLHAAVLVAEHDLEEQHLLAVRLKPEVPRLDDAGVYRADRDLVHLVASDLKKGVRLAVHRARPATGRQVILGMPAQRPPEPPRDSPGAPPHPPARRSARPPPSSSNRLTAQHPRGPTPRATAAPATAGE